MPITEQTLTVGEDGLITIQVARPVGSQVRVIVLENSGNREDETISFAEMQSNTGFALNVLANPAEDVWNDL